MLRYLPFVLVIALTLYCAFDVLGSDQRARRGLAKPLWVLIVLLVPVVGSVVWLVVSRTTPHAGGTGRRSHGPVAPDDDPEFLRRLDLERRRRESRTPPHSDGGTSRTADDGAPDDGTADDGTPDDGTTDDATTDDATDGTPSS